MFAVRRMQPPAWSRPPITDLRGDGETAHVVFEQRQHEVHSLVYISVARYVNDDALTFAEEDKEDGDFPSRARMTGEYYISDMSYGTEVLRGRGCPYVTVGTRFIERQVDGPALERDYLCLEVRITLDPSGSLVVTRIDSMAI